MAKTLRKNKLNLYQVIFSFCKVYYLKTDYARFRGLPIRLLFHRNQARSAIHLFRYRLCRDIKLLSDTDERRSYPPLYFTEKKRSSALYKTNADRQAIDGRLCKLTRYAFIRLLCHDTFYLTTSSKNNEIETECARPSCCPWARCVYIKGHHKIMTFTHKCNYA